MIALPSICIVICNSIKKTEHSKIGISKRINYFCDQINKEKSTNIYEKLKSVQIIEIQMLILICFMTNLCLQDTKPEQK